MLADLDARRGGALGQPAHQPRRLQDTVWRMEERGRIATGEWRREVLAPLGREARGAERLVLVAELVSLLVVGGKPKAPGTTKGIPCQRSRAPSSSVSVQRHSAAVRSSPIDFCEHGERRSTPAKREAAVAPARAAGDLARLEEPDSETRLGERERAGAAGYPAADDGNVRRPVEPHHRQGLAAARRASTRRWTSARS